MDLLLALSLKLLDGMALVVRHDGVRRCTTDTVVFTLNCLQLYNDNHFQINSAAVRSPAAEISRHLAVAAWQ